MSFDLAVFRATAPIDDKSALAIYRALCDGKTPALESSKRPRAFYVALTKQFPEIDDREDESPFAVAIEHTDRHVIMNVSFSHADEVRHAVLELAKKHDLDVFDPQAKKLLRASEPLGKAPPQKLKPKDGVALLAAKLGPKLAKLGFLPVATQRWGRETKDGILQQIGFNLGTRDVRVDVGIAPVRALAAIATALGAPNEPVPMMGLEYLYFRGWIPGEPWADKPPSAFNHDVSTETKATRSAGVFAKEIERYALPLFDDTATLKGVVRFFTAKKPPSTARRNWDISREDDSGPADRFWRADRGLLLVTATLALATPSKRRDVFAKAKSYAKRWGTKGAYRGGPALNAALKALESA